MATSIIPVQKSGTATNASGTNGVVKWVLVDDSTLLMSFSDVHPSSLTHGTLCYSGLPTGFTSIIVLVSNDSVGNLRLYLKNDGGIYVHYSGGSVASGVYYYGMMMTTK